MPGSTARRRVNRTLAFPVRVARLVETEARRERKSFNAVVVDILARQLGADDAGVAAFARDYVARMKAESGYRRPVAAEPFDREELHER